MRLLITGANGFIGKYFINHYSNKYDIQKFSFLNDNINQLECKGIDTVFHLSALVHQMGGASKEEYEKINVIQTLQLAKKAKESGVKQFVFMSTVKVYGEETADKYTEDTICTPEDDYGKSKLKAEIELQKLETNTFKVSIIRTPIVYGYGVKANIKNLVNLVNKVPVLPFAGIDNKRSMVYIGNLCYLIDTIIDKRQSGVFLATDDEPLSTTKLIQLIASELDKKLYLVKIPFFENALKLLKPSFHKRLYGSLEVDNRLTMKTLFGEARVNNAISKYSLEATLPYSVEDGIKFMIHGETK